MFHRALLILVLTACGVENATVEQSSEGNVSDDLTSSVSINLPAALGGGTTRTKPSPTTAPVNPHAAGVPQPGQEPGSAPGTATSALSPSFPDAADVSAWAPPAGDQGQTSSCQSWSTGYSMMGWWANHEGLSNAQFAPMFLYAQLVKGHCNQGSWPEQALSIMQSQGVDSFGDYQPNQWNLDCGTLPSQAQTANAGHFKVTGYKQLSLDNGPAAAIKATISAGRPAIVVIREDKAFHNAQPGHLLIGAPQSSEPVGDGHAITAFSYDAQGVWILNSWGTTYGNNGWAELSWDFVNGSNKGKANVYDVVDVTGVAFSCSDSNAQCAGWGARGECSKNPSYMLTNCCASCANPAPCADNPSACESLTLQFSPDVNNRACLDIFHDGSANLTQVEEYTCNGSGAQNFQFVDLGHGLFSLRHVDSGKCVDLYRAGTANGTRVELYDCNSSNAQAFSMVQRMGGAATFLNPSSGKCLDVNGGSPADLTKIQLWDCNQSSAQKWWTWAQ
jgi:hypothetical protein